MERLTALEHLLAGAGLSRANARRIDALLDLHGHPGGRSDDVGAALLRLIGRLTGRSAGDVGGQASALAREGAEALALGGCWCSSCVRAYLVGWKMGSDDKADEWYASIAKADIGVADEDDEDSSSSVLHCSGDPQPLRAMRAAADEADALDLPLGTGGPSADPGDEQRDTAK